MDLSTRYLGLKLSHPFMAGASPLADDLDGVRRLEDMGSSAIVLRSLFEEQIQTEAQFSQDDIDLGRDHTAEARSYFPEPFEYRFGPHAYLEHVRKAVSAVDVPVIASLNGASLAGWLEYSRLIEQAGADALELNIYHIATNPLEDGLSVENRVVDALAEVKKTVRIPVAVKLSPFFSSLANLVNRLQTAGADGLVLFNRFYQPDIDLDELEITPRLHLSDSSELLLRLNWLSILSPFYRGSLAASGGMHYITDAVKAIMAGADVVQMVSALMRRGPALLSSMILELRQWLADHEYKSLSQMRGSMNLSNCPNPQSFERGNYMRILQRWRNDGSAVR